MMVSCEEPIGMPLLGATRVYPGAAPITPKSHGPTTLEANWEDTKGKAVGLIGVNRRKL